jgi:hypothetical protein
MTRGMTPKTTASTMYKALHGTIRLEARTQAKHHRRPRNKTGRSVGDAELERVKARVFGGVPVNAERPDKCSYCGRPAVVRYRDRRACEKHESRLNQLVVNELADTDQDCPRVGATGGGGMDWGKVGL